MTTNIIKYNNQTLPYPTPLVSLERNNVYVNQYWGNSDKITLNGLITGNFDQIKTGQSGILGIFNQNFGNFEIYETTGSSRMVLSGTSNGNLNLTGELPMNGKSLILEIDGCYDGSSVPATWEISNDLINWSPFYLYKIKYYDRPSLPCATNHGVIFNKSFLFDQPLPYTGTTGIAHPGGSFITSDLTGNALGVYSGEYPYFSGKYIRLKGRYFGGSIIGMKLETSGDYIKNIYLRSGIVVQSISFEESAYSNLINYSIELNSSQLSGNVINPTNEYNFTENEDKTISLSHSISARGINTSKNPSKSNAMDNAIAFVKSNTGLAKIPTVKFISGLSIYSPFYMQNFSESIDRLNGVYSIQENYNTKTINSNWPGVLSYTCDITSGADSNVVQINLRGDYKGPKDGDIANLRNTFNLSELFLYSGYYNPTPIQYNITENSGENLISFDYTFDNIDLPNPYFKYDANITKDELQQIYNIQVRGDVIARGSAPYRYYLSTGNLVNLTGGFMKVASGILTGFKNFNSDTSTSNLRLLNISIDKNPNDSTVSANASYDDKYMPTGNFVNANYSVSVEAPLWYMNNQPTCNIKGYHIINDFNITTLPKLSVSTSFTSKNVTGLNNESQLKQQARDITANIVPRNYNFNVKLQDSESLTKKYDNFNSLSQISYKLDKIDISNENGLLPKFNAI